MTLARWTPAAQMELLSHTNDRRGSDYGYRGARIETCGPKSPTANFMRLAGHPYDGQPFARTREIQRLVDAWEDHDRLPDPYVGPRRVR